ncbi:nitrite/sulfite reductase [Amphiplicatus metriothermophilus]|uniref:Sulfite reductase (NADPH) hemoprotein beta-component n=1 Tax=Amphiplicatus metriothermophilus TaxID=1519374 RepID=A0A239PKU2_9PROT|nr:nitrite/sulfite reductase [Amphiplicatus metriothermophilus]MBB5517248.1 sulfite reductase (NADPH) hemoprotein beta-component [Amphiplicatus metriothermophilus]SNT68416.1 sulfite reductase (NADPH) hemoprotein beta-component [Amphiplicatus metriothermophilus]
MYRYDEFDETIVRERVKQFRGQVARRLSGELTEEQFKPLRLMNGLYLQLHAYMLRVAIPYGVLSSRQLRRLAHVARRYDKGYGHFTTRQNIQYNWPALVDVPDILDALADVEMHAIQTSGNCIRNVTSDQYAGAAADEVEDPRPWCEIIRQWSTFHPEFSYLPRKFKIAVTASPHDRAAVKVHDIGLILKKGEGGKTGFEVIVGGGLGRTPYIGHTIRDFLPKEHILSYLEAIMRVYNLNGRRDNLFKSRIKILVNTEGPENFRDQVEAEWEKIRDCDIDIPREEIERIKRYFAPPAFEALPGESASFEAARARDAGFDRWVRVNVVAHKVPGYAIANVSLKEPGRPPGDATAEQMEAVADLGERFSFDEIRVTHEQNLCLPHVRKDDLYAVYQALKEAGLAAANVGLASDIIACPGLDYCDLANARSIPIAQALAERFAASGEEEDLGELKINISGCINACGHHHIGHIGILGVDKKGEEFYQITLGGSGAEDASLGEIAGRGLSSSEVVDAVERLARFYKRERREGERFLDAYRRLGHDAFKGAIYADA